MARPSLQVHVQQEAFDTAVELEKLTEGRTDIGAVVTFTGLVRDMVGDLEALTLEHYPAMTEREMKRWAGEAEKRWSLTGLTIIHRYGRLTPGDSIVLVITASPHRAEAFAAAEFLMDKLKTQAPFWKSETKAGKTKWIDAKTSDFERAGRWGE